MDNRDFNRVMGRTEDKSDKPEKPETRRLRLQAVEASYQQAAREATMLLRMAGFRGKGRERTAPVIAAASRPCVARKGFKVSFPSVPCAVKPAPLPTASSRAAGNGREPRGATYGPVLTGLPTGLAGPVERFPIRSSKGESRTETVEIKDEHGKLIRKITGSVSNARVSAMDSTHGDITGKPGYANQ